MDTVVGAVVAGVGPKFSVQACEIVLIRRGVVGPLGGEVGLLGAVGLLSSDGGGVGLLVLFPIVEEGGVAGDGVFAPLRRLAASSAFICSISFCFRSSADEAI